MRDVWFLITCVVLVRGDIAAITTRPSASAILESILPNHVISGMVDVYPVEDHLIVAVDDWSVLHVNHLRIIVSLDSHNLQVDPDFNSSIIRFGSTGAFVNVVGDYKLRNATTFVSKGMLNVTYNDLKVSGTADLILGETCVSAHGCILNYTFQGTDMKLLHKEENGMFETENVAFDTLVTTFEELVHDDVVNVIRRRIVATLNSALCSVSISRLVGGEDEERLYRRRGLTPIPFFNEIVDTILQNLKPVIHSQGLDLLHLPDINTTFTVKESIFKLYGTFLAENGTIRNLTSLHRTSDCVLAGNGSFFLASGGVGMDEFNVTYNYVDATFEDVEFTGKIGVSFEVVSVGFKATMAVVNSTCYPSLDYIHVNELIKIHVEVEGHRSWLVKGIILTAFEKYKPKIVANIDAILKNLGAKYLKSFDCGNYFGK